MTNIILDTLIILINKYPNILASFKKKYHTYISIIDMLWLNIAITLRPCLVKKNLTGSFPVAIERRREC